MSKETERDLRAQLHAAEATNKRLLSKLDKLTRIVTEAQAIRAGLFAAIAHGDREHRLWLSTQLAIIWQPYDQAVHSALTTRGRPSE